MKDAIIDSDTQKASKIMEIEVLAEELKHLKREGRRIVHCHGVFDLLHVGHIRHFEEAKAAGDVLVVTLTPDHYVNKGPHRPAFPQELRAEVIASLGTVDYVAINRWPTAVNAIKLLCPDIYAKGPDYRDPASDITGGIRIEEEAVESVGGRVLFTDGVTFSSSALLNKHISAFPEAVNGYLDGFRRRHSAGEIRDYLDRLRSLRVVVVGEAILDEYVYCDAIGKSAKEPILAMLYRSQEMHAGGSLAIANHVAAFCDQVQLVTYLGAKDPRLEFVTKSLRPNVRPHFIYKSESPTIVKRRFVEKYMVTKLLEVYEMNDALLSRQEDEAFCAVLREQLPQCDLVISADFGHGLISPRAVALLSGAPPFLAVNTQINAANGGFHTISRYPRADYVCIHEGEIRLDHRDREGDLKPMVTELSRRMRCGEVMVTRGRTGTLLYREGEGFFECPSFAMKVIDRVGAGDAVLSLTALCAAAKLPADVVGFLGNIAGAQAVMVVGNSASIDRTALCKTVESMLK